MERKKTGFSPAHLPRLELSNNAAPPEVDVGVAAGLIPTYEALCDFYSVPVSRLFVQFVQDAVSAGQLELDLTDCPGKAQNESFSCF